MLVLQSLRYGSYALLFQDDTVSTPSLALPRVVLIVSLLPLSGARYQVILNAESSSRL